MTFRLPCMAGPLPCRGPSRRKPTGARSLCSLCELPSHAPCPVPMGLRVWSLRRTNKFRDVKPHQYALAMRSHLHLCSWPPSFGCPVRSETMPSRQRQTMPSLVTRRSKPPWCRVHHSSCVPTGNFITHAFCHKLRHGYIIGEP